MTPVKGTVNYDLSHDAWKMVDGNRCYKQRTILFRPDSISFPRKYRSNLPCIIRIAQRYERGDKEGELMYPDLYVLRDHMIMTKKLKWIQKGKCRGWVVTIDELEDYKPGHKLV